MGNDIIWQQVRGPLSKVIIYSLDSWVDQKITLKGVWLSGSYCPSELTLYNILNCTITTTSYVLDKINIYLFIVFLLIIKLFDYILLCINLSIDSVVHYSLSNQSFINEFHSLSHSPAYNYNYSIIP